MQFDYSKLLGRIKECGETQKTLSEKVGISESTMSLKLNNESFFGQREMLKICDALGLSYSDIGAYFFAPKVRKVRTNEEVTEDASC